VDVLLRGHAGVDQRQQCQRGLIKKFCSGEPCRWWCAVASGALRAGGAGPGGGHDRFALHGDIVMKPTMLLAIPLMVLQTLCVPASP